MKKFLLLLALTITLPDRALSAFIISTNSVCYGYNSYKYHFSRTTFSPDYTVRVSSTAFSPDLTIKIVSDPQLADLILVDNFQNGHMQICRQSSPFGAKTIKVSNTAFYPDITIKLSNYAYSADYTIFVSSERMTVEQAAALFAVIWYENRNN